MNRAAQILATGLLSLAAVYLAASMVHAARAAGAERAADVNAWHCHDWQDCP